MQPLITILSLDFFATPHNTWLTKQVIWNGKLYRSLRNADGRAFWVSLSRLQIYVSTYWDCWPTAVFPDNKPPMKHEIFEILNKFDVPCHISLASILPPPGLIVSVPWCSESWVQLEIATRNLSLHIDALFDSYHPYGCRTLIQQSTTFESKIAIIKAMNLLRD